MLGVFFAALFIVANGFFVAAEFALVKVSTMRGRGMEPKSHVHEVVGKLERYLSVTQFGITLASLGLGWLGEPAFERVFLRIAAPINNPETEKYVHGACVVLAFAALTLLHVLFGELVPKLVAIQKSDWVARSSALPLRVVYIMFRPLLALLETLTKIILRAMGLSADAASEGQMSEEEIIGILAANTARTTKGQEKSELIERVFRFTQRTARQAMIPRVDVFSLPVENNGGEAIGALRSHEFTRIVLTKGRSMDEVVGYLYAKDMLLDPDAANLRNLTSLAREILFVPEGQALMDVLREMQRGNTPIAIVVDEYGGSSGILTMEDILEEIVGEIRDEGDDEGAGVTRVPDVENAWDIDPRVSGDALRGTGAVLPDELLAEPLGSIVVARLGRLPRRGDCVDLAPHVRVEVLKIVKRRITALRLFIDPPIPPEETSNP